MDNSKAVQGVLMGLLSPHLIMGQHNQPIVLASSSEPHQHFLQCSTYLSHSHNPMQCMATFSPLRQGSSSPAVPSLCRNRWSMPTSRPASRTHLLCGPCTPKLCIQPLDSWLPPSFPYRYKQQGSQALPPPANLAPDSLSSNTARTQDSITSNHQRAPAHPPSLRLGSYVPQTNNVEAKARRRPRRKRRQGGLRGLAPGLRGRGGGAEPKTLARAPALRQRPRRDAGARDT